MVIGKMKEDLASGGFLPLLFELLPILWAVGEIVLGVFNAFGE